MHPLHNVFEGAKINSRPKWWKLLQGDKCTLFAPLKTGIVLSFERLTFHGYNLPAFSFLLSPDFKE
jgi:hypothetical protein